MLLKTYLDKTVIYINAQGYSCYCCHLAGVAVKPHIEEA